MDVSSYKVKRKNYKLKDYLKFVIPSLIGVLLLIMPFSYEGKTTILVALLANKTTKLIGNFIPTIVLVIIGISTIGSILYKVKKIDIIKNNQFLKSVFDISYVWIVIRTLGFIFAFLTYFKVGPNWIYSESTGGLILNDLVLTLFTIFLFAGFLLSILTDFGLLEYIGVLLTPIMRPFFKLPGRSSVNAIASWVGDGTIGVAMTNNQYEDGYYTKREAATIATNFSAVSITFCLVVLSQVGLQEIFGIFYITVTAIGLLVAMIMARIAPLSRKPDTYKNGEGKDHGETIPKEFSAHQWAVQLAIEKADENLDFKKFVVEGVKTVLDMWLGVLPAIMAFGTLGLILAEHTPIFQWLGLPFLPLLKIMNVPYAVEVSQTMMVGFADMFLPTVIGANIPSEMAKFIVAGISVNQLIYLSETGAVILGSNIDITVLELFIIFIERTLISLPLIVLAAKIIF